MSRRVFHQRLFITDKKKKNTFETASHFTLDMSSVQSYIRRVKSIQFISVGVNYTPTATTITEGFIHLKTLNHDEKHVNGENYHAHFPVTQGTIGTPLLFRYQFSYGYITDLFQLSDYLNQLEVIILRENASGNLVEFTEITS